MRVYIASKYQEHKDINLQIYELLLSENIEAFLPRSINVDAISLEEMFYVAETCYKEIEKCDIILIVEPFGKSVSSEVGYAISLKRNNKAKKLVLYHYQNQQDTSLKKEAMIMPYIDVEVDSLNDAISWIKNSNRY